MPIYTKRDGDFYLQKFKLAAQRKHDNFYNYSNSVYQNSSIPVIILCPIHGAFTQRVDSHLRGRGCQTCMRDKISKARSLTTDEFIIRAKKKFNDKFDYSQTEYLGTKTNVIIICKIHGAFNQTPETHLAGYTCCPQCSGTLIKNNDTFIQSAITVHGRTYDYSKMSYKTAHIKIEIICVAHGSFWQTPNSHLSGRGCPKCNASHGEETIRVQLTSMHIPFIEQLKFSDCKFKRPLPFDFGVYEYDSLSLLIEFHGQQHYAAVDKFGGEAEFQKLQIRDLIKKEYCEKINVPLMVIPYWDKAKVAEILKNYLLV